METFNRRESISLNLILSKENTSSFFFFHHFWENEIAFHLSHKKKNLSVHKCLSDFKKFKISEDITFNIYNFFLEFLLIKFRKRVGKIKI